MKKDDVIWRFDSRIDRVYSNAELENLPEPARQFIKIYAAWHKASGLWMMCGDNARHFNHRSDNPTLRSLGTGFADDVAAYDLATGVELTSDYGTICDYTLETGNLSPA